MDAIKEIGTPDACDDTQRQMLLMQQIDNCPIVSNMDQINTDGDMEGDACDNDDDNDSVLDNNSGVTNGTSIELNGETINVTNNTPRDEFPLDRTRSCNVDGNNGEGPPDTAVSTFHNCDNDLNASNMPILNVDDVDDDNDGLIEIYYLEHLDAIRYDLGGDGAKDESSDPDKHIGNTGAPTSEQPACMVELRRPCSAATNWHVVSTFNVNSSYRDATTNKPTWCLGSGSGTTNCVPSSDPVTDSGFVPIDDTGGDINALSGVLEGNGYAIRSLYIYRESASNAGLFLGMGQIVKFAIWVYWAH